ncbi:hypothetical protein V8G54_018556, partial [Vigna mungo]
WTSLLSTSILSRPNLFPSAVILFNLRVTFFTFLAILKRKTRELDEEKKWFTFILVVPEALRTCFLRFWHSNPSNTSSASKHTFPICLSHSRNPCFISFFSSASNSTPFTIDKVSLKLCTSSYRSKARETCS